MPILFLILIFPIVELTLLTMLAHTIGFGWTMLYLLGCFLLGSGMLRNQKLAGLLTLGSLMRQGQGISLYSLFWPLRFSLAGVLFIVPGVLSTLAAIALLLPFSGPALQPRAQPDPQADDVIEGEFQRVDEPRERLNKPE